MSDISSRMTFLASSSAMKTLSNISILPSSVDADLASSWRQQSEPFCSFSTELKSVDADLASSCPPTWPPPAPQLLIYGHGEAGQSYGGGRRRPVISPPPAPHAPHAPQPRRAVWAPVHGHTSRPAGLREFEFKLSTSTSIASRVPYLSSHTSRPGGPRRPRALVLLRGCQFRFACTAVLLRGCHAHPLTPALGLANAPSPCHQPLLPCPLQTHAVPAGGSASSSHQLFAV